MADSKTSTLSPREELYIAIKAAQEERSSVSSNFFSSRQYVKESSFTTELMVRNNLLTPPFEPERMYTLVESSGILPQCIDAMIQNIDGFGYDFKFKGTSETEDSKEALKEVEELQNFFDQVNEKESFRTVRIHLRKDIEVTGNGYLEVIRFMDNSIATIYHMDSKLTRLQAKQEEPYAYKIKMWRKGKHRPIPISRRFRRYAMKVSSTDSSALRWFKEYGDPRRMCAITGRYESDLKEGIKITDEASEVIHFKIGNGAYGVPRWSGQIANALGMNSADYVNWDLFENQVVPPLAIMVSGGTLTAESVKDVRSILLEKKGVENFNKVLILEAQSEGNVTDKSATKIELKEMSAARKEDAMFVQYTDKGEHRIRSAFRLPPMMAGRTDTYSKSTADSSKMVAEEQIFVPERSTFDEIINMTIMRDLNVKYWLYASKGPSLITGREIIDGFKEFSKAGIITINEGIRLANRVLNMDITKYPEPWADYPIPIVIELAKMGILKDLDEISTISEELSSYIMERRNPLPPDASTSDDNVEVTEDPLEDVEEDTKVATEEEMILAYAQLTRLKTIIKSLKEKRLFEDKATE